MEKIDVKTLNDNVFDLIGKEWVLITSGNKKDGFNMMTASWGCLGWLWNKPVAVIKWYGAKGGYHDVYVLEIMNAYK